MKLMLSQETDIFYYFLNIKFYYIRMKKNITIYVKEPEELKLTKEQREISKETTKAMLYLTENIKYSQSIAIIIKELIDWQDQIISQID